jgi:pSer/pThr/pTyr-binding forkhead associated (FHA) protein
MDCEAMLEDAGSKNGTYLQGERITAPAALANGDEIQVGPFVLTYKIVATLTPTETDSQ